MVQVIFSCIKHGSLGRGESARVNYRKLHVRQQLDAGKNQLQTARYTATGARGHESGALSSAPANGETHKSQLFFDVMGLNLEMSCTTFLSPHLGHLACRESRSLMVIVTVNFLLHWLHR
jgi:hypothetical protein